MSSVTDPSVRAATEADALAVAEIWHQGWIDGHLGHVPQSLVDARDGASFRHRTPLRVADTTVALVDGDIAGFIMVVDDEVEQVYVSEHHRGGGIAELLLDESERLVRDAGYSTAWLAVVPGNSRARRFYERRGWSDAGLFDYGAADGEGEKNAVAVPCHRYEKPVT